MVRWLMRPVNGPDPLADSLSEDASGSPFSRIAGGLAVPLVLSFLGLRACLRQHAVLLGRGRGQHLDLDGPTAVAFGIAVLAVAAFVHVHFVWTVSERLFRWADPAKVVSLLLLLAAVVYVVWQVARN